ncbi:MAG TPA: CHAT domain-containing tetratricopeptide repeat protein [Longimicrobium sp.]|nr:CHAT domain-containing tetratricopeptide repeat protein [Longimicrobium sp.]
MLALTLPVLLVTFVAVGPRAEPPKRTFLGDLAREVRKEEVADVRLSIPSAFHSCSAPPGSLQTTSGCTDEARTPSRRVLGVVRRARAATRASADPDALQALAVVNLLFAGEVKIPLYQSISSLESASRLSERPAPALADLAAAHLMLARRGEGARHLIQAMDAAERALAHEPGNVAARFNGAEALDRMGLRRQAAEAWKRYLAADSASPWGHRARQRWGELAAPPSRPPAPPSSGPPAEMAAYARARPREARDLGWDVLLDDWSRAVLSGDITTARHRLEQAEAVGQALAVRPGDASLSDAVAEIRRNAADGAATRRVAIAHRRFAGARAAYLRGDYETACPRFRQVAEGAGPEVLLAWAWTYVGICLHYQQQSAESARLLETLASRADTIRHPALAGRRWWTLAGVLLSLGRYEEALAPLRRAFPLLERAGEREYAGGVLTQLGYAELQLGDPGAGYESLHHALSMLRDYPGSVSLHNLLYALADATAADGFAQAALRVHDEAVTMAEGMPRQFHAEALLARARFRSAAGHGGMDADVSAATAIMERVDVKFARGWLGAALRQTRAERWLDTHPHRAVAELDSVVAFFAGQDVPARLVPALFDRARAQLALKRPDSAATDLHRAVGVLDTLRAHVTSAQLRASLLEASRRVFDGAVMLSLDDGRPEQALAYVEQSRASFSPVGRAASWAPRRPRSPPGEVAVEFALIGDTLLAWTLEGTRLEMKSRVVRRAELLHQVEQVRAAMEHGAPEAAVHAPLEALYDALIRPLHGRLGPPGTPLLVVADGELAALPLAALRDRETGRYLVHDHAVRFASSLRDPEGTPRRGTAGMPVTLIANPAFDPRSFPELDPLPGASAEAKAVSRLYAGARVVEGGDAGIDAVRGALRQGGIAHFAGHAVFDDARPERSYLVVASPGDGVAARLTAAEIERMDLRGLRLVVLSACQTSRGQSGRSGGFAGLSGAFLAAGANGMVGSLWRVDDQPTRVLMEAFHEAYRASGDPVAALRDAQLHLLRSNRAELRSPSAWAGFRYAGGR